MPVLLSRKGMLMQRAMPDSEAGGRGMLAKAKRQADEAALVKVVVKSGAFVGGMGEDWRRCCWVVMLLLFEFVGM